MALQTMAITFRYKIMKYITKYKLSNVSNYKSIYSIIMTKYWHILVIASELLC